MSMQSRAIPILVALALLFVACAPEPIVNKKTVNTDQEQPDVAGRVRAMSGHVHAPTPVLDLRYRVEINDSNHALDSPWYRIEAVYRVEPDQVETWRAAFEKAGFSPEKHLDVAAMEAFLASTSWKPADAPVRLRSGDSQVVLYPGDGLIQIHVGHTYTSTILPQDPR